MHNDDALRRLSCNSLLVYIVKTSYLVMGTVTFSFDDVGESWLQFCIQEDVLTHKDMCVLKACSKSWNGWWCKNMTVCLCHMFVKITVLWCKTSS